MSAGNMPQELAAALDGMRVTIKAKGENRIYDKNISNLVKLIDGFWGDMRTIYCRQCAPSLNEDKEEKENIFWESGLDMPVVAPSTDGRPTNCRDAMEVIFPCFVDEAFPLERALDSKQDAVMKLLPYLLSAYYLSIYRIPLSYSVGKRLFPDAENATRDHNFGTEVNRFVARFSLADRIPAFLSSKRKREPDLERLNSRDEMLDYLWTSPKAEVYYSQVIKAFIYSICATACIRTLPDENKRKIDFELSYRLFDEHTLAFSSPYGVSELDEADLEELKYSCRLLDDSEADMDEVRNGFDLLKCLKRERPAEWNQRYNAKVAAIAQCVQPAFSAEAVPNVYRLLRSTAFLACSTNSPYFYMQYATMCCVLYNPLTWPGLRHYQRLIGRVLRYDRQKQCYRAPYLSGPRLKM